MKHKMTIVDYLIPIAFAAAEAIYNVYRERSLKLECYEDALEMIEEKRREEESKKNQKPVMKVRRR